MKLFSNLISKWSIALCVTLGGFSQTSYSQRVVGYMPSWAGDANSIQYTKLTHINYSFALPNADGTIKPLDNPAKLQTIVNRGHQNGVKVLLAVGGWTDNNVLIDPRFEAFAASASGRNTFVNACISLVNTYNLDGIDIDWEYPDPGQSAINCQMLMTQLGTELHNRGKLLTMAVIGNGNTGEGVNSTVLSIIDGLNIMAYDANDYQHSTYDYALSCLNYWGNTRGCAKSKINLGVPFYGRPSWESYAALVNRGADPNADLFAGIGYNGIPTIKRKAQYVKSQGYGGIMIWELSQDLSNQNSLLSAIKDVMGTTSNQAPTVSLTSPAGGSSFNSPATITISANASDPDGSISKVDFYNGSTLLFSDNSAPYSYTWSNVSVGSYTITARATDNAGAVTTSGAATITVTQPAVQAPYNGVIAQIPGKIEAENYDLGGQGVAYNETTTANQGNAYRTSEAVDVEPSTDAGGGFNIGYIVAGEWVEYTVNVATTGIYKLEARVAAITAGKTFHIELNGTNVSGTITVPNTGAWQNWQTVTINNISLTAGQKILKIAMDSGDFNLNFITFSTSSPSNQPPTVSLTSPSGGATFTSPATVNITATAADADGTVSKVDFYNGSTLLASDNSAPYSYSWTNVATGSYSITARATDNAGAVTTSAAVNITVNAAGNQPPTVSLTSPSNGATFNAPATVNIAATAADANGFVTKVDFYNGSTLLFSDNSSPYSYSWPNVAAGTYSITAKATDNAGAVTTSAAVNITVNTVNTGGCSGIPQYIASGTTNYVAGSKVVNNGNQYECKPFPYSGWCNVGGWAYTPGTGTYWTEAWILVGSCSSSAAAPAPLATVSGPNPTTGDVYIYTATTSRVEVYNGYGTLVIPATDVEPYGSIDLSKIPGGQYILKIYNGGDVRTERLIKL